MTTYIAAVSSSNSSQSRWRCILGLMLAIGVNATASLANALETAEDAEKVDAVTALEVLSIGDLSVYTEFVPDTDPNSGQEMDDEGYDCSDASACAGIVWRCIGDGWRDRIIGDSDGNDTPPWKLDQNMCQAVQQLRDFGYTRIRCEIDPDGDGVFEPYTPNCPTEPS
ncbi:MAG: hypothetical protein QY326_09890 [Bdellovibrionota bacterium]|nr:MAG: hypothetical protein QY326_09890 [Bdellovibrionota bacterium]